MEPTYRGLLTISAIALFALGLTPFFYNSTNFEPTFAQTSQSQNVTSNLNNTTISYSYNIYVNNTEVQLNSSSISYHDNVIGYLVYPSNPQEELPAVIMIHEWWGLNEHIKTQADALAREGYVVLAVDLYDGEVATDFNRARELSSSVRNDSAAAIENLQSAVSYVRSLHVVDGSRIASLGWCFGGDWSLQLALNSTENPLAATVLYYGRPATDADSISNITWPVLGIFGDQDQAISVESVTQFASALNASQVTNEIYLYKGRGHAFANPSGDNYAPEETVDAWQKTLAFLERHL